MIRESCNLIGRKPILVASLNVYVIHKEMTLLFPRNSIKITFWIICSVALPPHANQNHPVILSGYTWLHLTSSSTLTCCLPLVTISIQKIYDTDCFPPKTLKINESCNINGQEYILVSNLKLCIFTSWKKNFFT